MAEIYHALPTWAQDVLVMLGLLTPLMVVGVIVLRGFHVRPLLVGLLRRQVWISAVFTALIAVSVALGTGLIAQERGLRQGTARAADKFDLIIAAPGSEITAMLAAVYLQPSDLPLLDGATYAEIAQHPRVSLVAPLGFGDSWRDAPVVGTTAGFVDHLSEGLAAGRLFMTEDEAIAGARVSLDVGDSFAPAHGVGDTAEHGAHGDRSSRSGRSTAWPTAMDRTGTGRSVRRSLRLIFPERRPHSCGPSRWARPTACRPNSRPRAPWPFSPVPFWPGSTR